MLYVIINTGENKRMDKTIANKNRTRPAGELCKISGYTVQVQ